MISIARFLTSAAACCLFWPLPLLHAEAALSTQQQQLIAADRGIWQAMAGEHPDAARVTQALAPEYMDVEEGQAQSRAEVLAQLAQLSGLSFQYSKPQAVVLSPSTGYVVAEVQYSFSFVRGHKLTTTAFVLRNGSWVATLHTETPVVNDRQDILATPDDSRPELIAMRRLAMDVMSHVQVPGYAPFPYYPVFFDAGTAISFSDTRSAHEADFGALPAPMQQVWTKWATYTRDEPSGQALFSDMFYRFFLVHEFGHLIANRVAHGLPDAEQKQVSANRRANAVEEELVANRIATAWFREHDPQYLARLVMDFQLIEARLPNPVPAGADPKRYFTDNYLKLANDPMAYGWYQLYMVISVYNEPPKTFAQMLATLPALRYNEE